MTIDEYNDMSVRDVALALEALHNYVDDLATLSDANDILCPNCVLIHLCKEVLKDKMCMLDFWADYNFRSRKFEPKEIDDGCNK